MRKLRSVVVAAALSLFAAPHADAAPIDLNVAITYYTPAVGPPDASLAFWLFESATNGWPGAPLPQPPLASGGGALLPGVTQYPVALNIADPSHTYFIADGSYLSGPFLIFRSIFVAEPPTGHVSDESAFVFGPPWISLANLGSGGLSGDLWTINGFSNQGDGSFKVGSWQVTSAPEVAPVPEPTTVFLLGTGVAAAIRRPRRKKRH